MNSHTCIFCKIISKQIPARIVYEDPDLLAFDDLKPQAPVHIVIVPKVHIPTVSSLSPDSSALAGKLIMAAKEIARQCSIAESGYRVVINCNKAGGQEVYHLHLHLLGGRQLGWPPG